MLNEQFLENKVREGIASGILGLDNLIFNKGLQSLQ